jgi:hypothetical protein
VWREWFAAGDSRSASPPASDADAGEADGEGRERRRSSPDIAPPVGVLDFVPSLCDGGHSGRRGVGAESRVLVGEAALRRVAGALPTRYAVSDWHLLYSTDRDGISLQTFYLRAAACGACVLAMRSTRGRVFGGFASEVRAPASPERFYGSGECFLFALPRQPLPGAPEPDGGAPRVYRWSGQNRHFCFSHKSYFAMGSGGRHGLWVDSEFLHGSSGASATFGNACLCDEPPPDDGSAAPPAAAQSGGDAGGGEVTCDVFEAWGLEPSVIAKRQRDLARKRIIQSC